VEAVVVVRAFQRFERVYTLTAERQDPQANAGEGKKDIKAISRKTRTELVASEEKRLLLVAGRGEGWCLPSLRTDD